MGRNIFLQDTKALKLLLESARSMLCDSRETGFHQDDAETRYEEMRKGLETLEQWIGEVEALDSANVQLEEREAQLEAENEEIKNQAEMVSSYNELLLELTRKRREWILVVDAETKGIIYCNKRKAGQTEAEDEEFCEVCEKRLPFRNSILGWEDNGQNHVWEVSDGDHRYYSITTFPLEWQGRQAYAHILMDITDEKLKTRTLKDKAYHDGLTGIYNRIYFEEYMARVLEEKTNVILGYLDLDCLKTVNDKYGHEEGDGYIRRFVSTVKKHFRTTDIFARIGGDEFCLILDNIEKQVAEEKLEMAMREFQSYDDKEYIHGFSFGTTEITGKTEARTLSQIIKEVDSAMYQCKRQNKELYKKRQQENKE